MAGKSEFKTLLKECGLVRHAPSSLLNHVRTAHTKEKPFSCEFCGESFSSSVTFRIHKKTHMKKEDLFEEKI